MGDDPIRGIDGGDPGGGEPVSPGVLPSLHPGRRHPDHPDHHDEAAVRNELTRVFGVCASCRRCVDRCASFPRLFDLLDGSGVDDPGMLTPAEQDHIVDGCHQCDRCTVECPFGPAEHEAAVDVAGLMLTAKAMQRSSGHRVRSARLADHVLDPAGLTGAAVSVVTRGGRRRWSRPVATAFGVSESGLPGPRSEQRFSTWFRSRTPHAEHPGTRPVVLLPTCVVEYRDPGLGVDTVDLLEAAGAAIDLATSSCCGAYWLRVGDLGRYLGAAEDFAARTARQLRSNGAVLVVVDPTCSQTITARAPDLVGASTRPDAEFVADRTFGAAAFALAGDPARLLPQRAHTRCPDVPERLVYAPSCHARTTGASDAAVEMLRRAGAEVTVVPTCPGVGGTWGARVANEAVAVQIGGRADRAVGAALAEPGAARLVGDCPGANAAVARRTGMRPVDPVSLLAEAVRGGWSISPDRHEPG